MSLPVWPVLLVFSCPGWMGSSSIHLTCPAPPTPHLGRHWWNRHRYPASHALQLNVALRWVCTGTCQLLPRRDPSRSELRRIGSYYVPWFELHYKHIYSGILSQWFSLVYSVVCIVIFLFMKCFYCFFCFFYVNTLNRCFSFTLLMLFNFVCLQWWE